MESDEIKELIDREIIGPRFPDFADVKPDIESGPSESNLRALRRMRAVISESEIRQLPIEHRFTYRVSEDENNPYDKTLVVVTDDDGAPKYYIESK